MTRGRDDFWTGWVEIDPIVLPQEEKQQQQQQKAREPDARNDAASGGGGGGGGVRNIDGDGSSSSNGAVPARLHLDLRFAPMERWINLLN